ncbi:MAG: carbohydrate ABC transporter permease [Elusimicrobia bacterium]|nr:carbohydrate ABC transporter permease [Elusimicrobiota bacterium]
MGLLRTQGKKDLGTIIVIVIMYFLLITGGITMIYPFLIMISGSFKSGVDIYDYDAIPRYFYSNEALYQKYIETKYNESLTEYNENARDDKFNFAKLTLPDKIHEGRIKDWQEFTDKVKMPSTYGILGNFISYNNKMLPEMGRKYRKWLQKKWNNSLKEYNRVHDASSTSWLMVNPPPINSVAGRSFTLAASKTLSSAFEFKTEQPSRYYYYLSLDGRYVRTLLYMKYGKNIETYNKAHGTNYKSYNEFILTRTVPENKKQAEDWTEFVQKQLNLRYISVSPKAKADFLNFLSKKYEGSISFLNKIYGTKYKNFEEVPYLEDALKIGGTGLVDWNVFVMQISPRYITLTGPEFLWQDYLKEKYKNIKTLNQAHEAEYASFEKIPMPTEDVNYQNMLKHSKQIRWEFITRNYIHVFQYLLLQGRGIWNTFVYCLLSILITITVNPMAAYAMSRFNLPSTYKIILFLLATMAFPPMVTAIPNFLLLKQLGMLNTFWALILPGMVNGYSIFLLKGFFDSLPRELYESAMLDGANEWVMFWNITMYLSKPILAVIALGAFNGAYGAFMFAFIVCQDEKMWTIMVWLYQLQDLTHQSVTFAALIIAAIPTFIIFVFAQNLIMRGIVVPTEK